MKALQSKDFLAIVSSFFITSGSPSKGKDVGATSSGPEPQSDCHLPSSTHDLAESAIAKHAKSNQCTIPSSSLDALSKLCVKTFVF